MGDDKKTQSNKFKEAARQPEADEDEQRWEKKLRRVATTKPDEKPSLWRAWRAYRPQPAVAR